MPKKFKKYVYMYIDTNITQCKIKDSKICSRYLWHGSVNLHKCDHRDILVIFWRKMFSVCKIELKLENIYLNHSAALYIWKHTVTHTILMLTCLSHERLWYIIVNMCFIFIREGFFFTQTHLFFSTMKKRKNRISRWNSIWKNTTEVEGS